jgi:hypothetical protein
LGDDPTVGGAVIADVEPPETPDVARLAQVLGRKFFIIVQLGERIDDS